MASSCASGKRIRGLRIANNKLRTNRTERLKLIIEAL
jgi:hypothetical protein